MARKANLGSEFRRTRQQLSLYTGPSTTLPRTAQAEIRLGGALPRHQPSCVRQRLAVANAGSVDEQQAMDQIVEPGVFQRHSGRHVDDAFDEFSEFQIRLLVPPAQKFLSAHPIAGGQTLGFRNQE